MSVFHELHHYRSAHHKPTAHHNSEPSGETPAGGRPHFLYCAKTILILIIIWIVALLTKHVDYIAKFNELSLAIPGDDELLLDVSQSVELPFQQDLSFSISDGIKSGAIVANCGVRRVCADNEFAIHLFTGIDNQEYPKLCIDGKYVLDRGLNNCGRGLNVAVIDNITRSILRVSNFDTYDKDSTPLEALLLTLRHGDIIVIMTFDEPTSKLSQIAKLLLHEMGSNMAQNLIYRSSWYIITQKGINGYTPYENLHLPDNGGWAQTHDIRTCIPLNIQAIAVQPDPIVHENKRRAQFCAKHANQFPLFCEGNLINDPLITAHIIKNLPISEEIWRTPIVVLTSPQSYADNVYLPLTLETLFLQPGIIQRNVLVFYHPIRCPLIASLADVFDFMSTEFSETSANILDDLLRTADLLFPDANHFIVIDVNTILSPDFISYMGQLLPYLSDDKSNIAAISAWNDNGFETTTSNDSSLIYLAKAVNYRPRFAAMFKRGFTFGENLWSFSDKWPISGHVILPDVSRVLFLNQPHTHSQIMTYNEMVENFVFDFMQRKRSINMEDEVLLNKDGIGDCVESYEEKIKDLIHSSIVADDIEHLRTLLLASSDNSKRYLMIYCDIEIHCKQLCQELGLANCLPHMSIKEIGGIIRFSKNMDTIFLIIKN